MNFRKQDLRFFLLLFIGMADLIFIINLFVPILDDKGDLKNGVTLLIEGGIFLPIAYYFATHFFQKEMKQKEEDKINEEKIKKELLDELDYQVTDRLCNCYINLVDINDIPLDNMLISNTLTQLKEIDEIYDDLRKYDFESKRHLNECYGHLNQARVYLNAAGVSDLVERIFEDLDKSKLSLIAFSDSSGILIARSMDEEHRDSKYDVPRSHLL